MPTAVVRLVIGSAESLSPNEFQNGVDRLRDAGFEVVAPSPDPASVGGREIEVIADLDDIEPARILAAGAAAFPTTVTPGVITYISRGTDEDARGVLDRFEVAGEIRREIRGDEEIVHVTMARVESRRVPESRLHTALEAALNCEVRINYR